MARGILKHLLPVLILLIAVAAVECGGKTDFRKVKNPCAITRNIKSNVVIRVVDEVNDEPGVILGEKGLLYYTLIASRIQREVVIECSSSHSQVKWMYKGVGASSGFKIVNTRWSGSDINRTPSCYSTAIVISHVTDQLTGEYRCQEVNSTRSKGPRRNSFKLFVPSTPPTYPEDGSEVNVTVSNEQEKHLKSVVVLPCISKKMKGQVLLYRIDNETEQREQATYSNMRYDPFTGFIIPKSSLSFSNHSRILHHECRFTGSNSTFLRVNLVLESDEKIAPERSLVKSSSPYLSWTTKYNPKLQFTPDISSSVLIWQQFYTKKGFEEISSDAPMFYLGSATVVNMSYGSEGEVELYDGSGSPEDGVIHKWKYLILDALDEQNAGLKYEEYEYFHVFICKSASSEKPVITFNDVLEDGTVGTNNVSGTYNITNCPEERAYGRVGCVILTSYVNQGVVRCIGDGVSETFRYPPPLPFEAGRPYFVERGADLVVTIPPEAEKLRIPCLTNSEVSTSVFLYKMTGDGYKKIWSEDDEEFGDSEIEFYPSSGFILPQSSSGESQDLEGEYLCSSSVDPDDRSDSVGVVVRKEIGTNYKIHPAEERVFGRIPVKFSWEADEELEVVSLSTPLRNISLGREENDPNYKFGNKIVIMEHTPEGETRNVSLRRKSDGVILHTWTFQQIDRSADHRAGLIVEMKEDKGEGFIVATCRSKTNVSPRIRYYHCLNEDTCDLMRKCHEKDCYNPNFRHEEKPNQGIMDDCDSQGGCSGIVIRSMYVNGILNFSCDGDGVKDFHVVRDVFFKEDIVWDTEKTEDAYVYLSTAHSPVHATDQNPEREVQFIGSNIEWEMGETVEFSCVAAPYLYSNGIKWALETKKGKMIFQKDSVFDVQFKYTGSAQVASTFSLLIDRFDYARVYCFVPKLDSPHEWHNASMPIFVRSEASDDSCHEENSIHLINVYPTPSKLNLELNDTRLDKLPYFVVPDNVLQFAVKISGPKPFSWTFHGSGPTRTPLIQSDRQVQDFFDSSTYCYSSRLLINLRHKSPNDTGRYVVKHKYESRELASFYIFVPSKNPPYLLSSGSTVNITLPEDGSSFYVPCLVNSPDVDVELVRVDEMAETMKGDLESEIKYDPTRGFLINKVDNSSADKPLVYKCTANKNDSDSVIVYVNPPQRIPELKYEKVNDFHVFTCKSASSTPPEMELTEIADDGTPLEANSTEHKTRRCSAGCVALITRVNQGRVSCVGEGISETFRFPPTHSANKRNSDKSVGLWFDNATNSFKCQTNSVESPTLAAVTCRRPNECEIMKRLLHGGGDESRANYSQCGEGCAELQVKVQETSYTAPNWFSIFLRCKGEDNMEILSQYFYDKGEMIYASLENAEGMKKIRIDVPALRRQGKMVFATFRCFANRYFYSRGFQWGLEGRNGILEFPATPASQIEVQHFSAVMSSINLEIDENIHTAVYCFVPLLDSPAWANSTLKFPIEQLQVNF